MFVLNQARYPGAGDVDDCWVVASTQMVLERMGWLRWPTVPEFRAAAGNPDKPGPTGGDIDDIVKGIAGLWPQLAGKVKPMKKASWPTLLSHLVAGRIVSVATDSSKLPADVRYGFNGAHQIAIERRTDGKIRLANPLAPVYTRWDVVASIDLLKPAIMGYGKLRVGTASVFAVAGLTEAEAVRLHPAYAAQVKAAVDAATAAVAAENQALKEKVAADHILTASAVADAEESILSLGAFVGRFKQEVP